MAWEGSLASCSSGIYGESGSLWLWELSVFQQVDAPCPESHLGHHLGNLPHQMTQQLTEGMYDGRP